MRSGKLRHRLRVKTLSMSKGPLGKEKQFVVGPSIAAEVTEEHGESVERITCLIRYRSLSIKDRVDYQGREFEITSCTPDPRRRSVTFVAQRKVG